MSKQIIIINTAGCPFRHGNRCGHQDYGRECVMSDSEWFPEHCPLEYVQLKAGVK